LNFTAFWIYDFIKTCFSKVTTLSQKLIFARTAENNRDRIFSKLGFDAGYDNVSKSPKNHFLKKCGLRPFVLHSRYNAHLYEAVWRNGDIGDINTKLVMLGVHY